MKPAELTQLLKEKALNLGFSLAGVCPAIEPEGITRFRDWLEAGYSGEMDYLTTRCEAYEHPRHVLAGVRSLLMLAFPYRNQTPISPSSGEGRVSRYAWGVDYHDLVHERLQQLLEYLAQIEPGISARGVIDTAPLLEREFAQLASLGWIGKNTLLISRSQGSWFFLACVLIGQELVYDSPMEKDYCGSCRACLEECPTQAFVAPGVLDSRRCISYLTIEYRGVIARELRSGIGDWLFGCDVCQEVCPWNHRAVNNSEPELYPASGMNPVDLIGLFSLDEAAFRARFRNTPLWRARRRGILRNAAIVLGNQKCREGKSILIQALSDSEPLVRGASAWALGQMHDPEIQQILREKLTLEEDEQTREEIRFALEEASSQNQA